jgi:hypothetical protein
MMNDPSTVPARPEVDQATPRQHAEAIMTSFLLTSIIVPCETVAP